MQGSQTTRMGTVVKIHSNTTYLHFHGTDIMQVRRYSRPKVQLWANSRKDLKTGLWYFSVL